MLVMEGAYPMVKDNNPAFFYKCLVGAIVVSFFSVVFCIWRDSLKDKAKDIKIVPEKQQTPTNMKLSKIIANILGMSIIIFIVILIELLAFPGNYTSVGIGITTGIISGAIVLLFQGLMPPLDWS